MEESAVMLIPLSFSPLEVIPERWKMEIGDDGEISDELLYNATPCLDEGTQCLHLDSSLCTVKFKSKS